MAKGWEELKFEFKNLPLDGTGLLVLFLSHF